MNCPICGAPVVVDGLALVCPKGHGRISTPAPIAGKPASTPQSADLLFSEPVFRDESLVSARCDACGKPLEIPAFEYYNTLAVCRIILCDSCQMERLKKALPQYFRE